jgi:heat shock protein HslJ
MGSVRRRIDKPKGRAAVLPRMLRLLAIALATGLLCSAGAAEAASGLSALAETYWRLARVDGTADYGSEAVVRIRREKVDFSTPCSYVSYPFHYEADDLTFASSPTESGSTTCAKDQSEIAVHFSERLHKAKRHELTAAGLTLFDEQDRPLIQLARLQPTGLENRRWFIAAYFDGAKLAAVDTRISFAPNIAFLNGRIDGSPGCASLFGWYTLNDDHLDATAMSVLGGGWCQEDYGRQTTHIFEALSGSRRVEQDGERILLRDERGTVRLVLSPCPPTSCSRGGSRP